jgi:hypothetical protein
MRHGIVATPIKKPPTGRIMEMRLLVSADRFGALALAACLAVSTGAAFSQEYPARQIRAVLPFPAGGGSDLIARVTAQR